MNFVFSISFYIWSIFFLHFHISLLPWRLFTPLLVPVVVVCVQINEYYICCRQSFSGFSTFYTCHTWISRRHASHLTVCGKEGIYTMIKMHQWSQALTKYADIASHLYLWSVLCTIQVAYFILQQVYYIVLYVLF